MSKKFLATLALAIAALFAFVGCSGETYNFTALTGSPAADAEVRSNGGIYVEKGNYSYFINGAENGTATNNFGDEHKGAIVRCLTADLTNPARQVEVVVPKIIYSEEADSSGFYIFGDRIYYATPNNSKDSNGNVQYTKIDFMSVNLNGTDTRLLATMDDITKPFVIVQNNGDVFIFYEGTDTIRVNDVDTSVTALYEINAQTQEVKKIDNDVAGYSFDRTDGGKSVAYTKTQRKTTDSTGKEETESRYNVLYEYTAGAEESKIIKNGKPDDNAIGADALKYEVMTVQTVAYGSVYYTYTQSVTQATGLVKVTGETAKELAPKVFTGFLPAENEDAIYIQDNGWIKKFVFENGNINSAKTILICSESGEITLEKIVGKYLFYSSDYKVFRLEKDTANQSAKTVVDGQMQTTTWASFDYALRGEGDEQTVAVFYFNDSETITYSNYLYMDTLGKDEKGDDEIVSKRIGKLIKANWDNAVENGDDKNGVDNLNP